MFYLLSHVVLFRPSTQHWSMFIFLKTIITCVEKQHFTKEAALWNEERRTKQRLAVNREAIEMRRQQWGYAERRDWRLNVVSSLQKSLHLEGDQI